MNNNRRIKILATLGPSSADRKSIEKLYRAGANVFRINMSHASHEDLRERREIIRAIERDANRPIGILCDLQGPKLRVGLFKEAVILEEGASFTFDRSEEPGTNSRVFLPHPEIFKGIAPGHQLLLNDGKLRLTVTHKTEDKIETVVNVGGELSSRKGVSLPDTVLPLSPLTERDRENLEYASNLGVDWIALSFVQRAEDVIEAKQLVDGRASVLSKIEKPSAVDDIERIVQESDAIMVARGDLGVEMPLQRVPGVQKKLTRLSRQYGKPVVIATQMLESMITAPVPTRAEVSDVATAVFEGADAIMLSAESAAGKYTSEAVATMDAIAREVEQDPLYSQILHAQRPLPDPTPPGAISTAACSIAADLGLKAIVCYTSTGSTAMRVARHRPDTPILALSTSKATARKLTITWGLHCVLTEDPKSIADMVTRACRLTASAGLAKENDQIIITAGLPFGTPGATNMIRVVNVDAQAVRIAMSAPEKLGPDFR